MSTTPALPALAAKLAQLLAAQGQRIDRAEQAASASAAQWAVDAARLRSKIKDTERAFAALAHASRDAHAQLSAQAREELRLSAEQLSARLAEQQTQIEALTARADVPPSITRAVIEQVKASAELTQRVDELHTLVHSAARPPHARALKAAVQRAVSEAMAALDSGLRRNDGGAVLDSGLRRNDGGAALDSGLHRNDGAAANDHALTGWVPLLRLEPHPTKTALKIHDWIGGSGDKPATGYIGKTGLVRTVADAVNLRGPSGASVIQHAESDPRAVQVFPLTGTQTVIAAADHGLPRPRVSVQAADGRVAYAGIQIAADGGITITTIQPQPGAVALVE